MSKWKLKKEKLGIPLSRSKMALQMEPFHLYLDVKHSSRNGVRPGSCCARFFFIVCGFVEKNRRRMLGGRGGSRMANGKHPSTEFLAMIFSFVSEGKSAVLRTFCRQIPES